MIAAASGGASGRSPAVVFGSEAWLDRREALGGASACWQAGLDRGVGALWSRRASRCVRPLARSSGLIPRRATPLMPLNVDRPRRRRARAAQSACAARPDLQPRHLRPRPYPALPRHRQLAGRELSSYISDHRLGLVGDLELPVRRRRRLCPHSRRREAERRTLRPASPQSRSRPTPSACAPTSSSRWCCPSIPTSCIVDKEPIGLRGELIPALDILRRRGARIVLGLRDVLDEPAQAARGMAPERRARGARPDL